VPTVLRVEGFRFFFFSNERGEPPHVHVERGDATAKIWLDDVRIAYSYGLSPTEGRRLRELTFTHRSLFLERWNEHFGR
jgi:hypothetical protein